MLGWDPAAGERATPSGAGGTPGAYGNESPGAPYPALLAHTKCTVPVCFFQDWS